MKLHVNLGENSYDIVIEKGLLKKASEEIREVYSGKRIAVISDDSVYRIYGGELLNQLKSTWECSTVILPHGETSKSINVLPGVYAKLLESGLSRSDLIVALGGGVIGDLAGFVAATYLRGVPFIQIPTSLLAQVDSSVGGKVAVDLKEGKNLVGSFYQPKKVLIDPDVIATLPQRYIHDGMGEVIKYGCIKDASLFATLKEAGTFERLAEKMTEVITRCVDIKRGVVEEDQFDTGERMLLNFGHTLAHAIEQKFAYGRESHGEAVAIGMYQITRISEEQGLTKEGTAEEIRKILASYGLPVSCGVNLGELKEAMKRDKKNYKNSLRLILLEEIGKSRIHPSDLSFFKDSQMA